MENFFQMKLTQIAIITRLSLKVSTEHHECHHYCPMLFAGPAWYRLSSDVSGVSVRLSVSGLPPSTPVSMVPSHLGILSPQYIPAMPVMSHHQPNISSLSMTHVLSIS